MTASDHSDGHRATSSTAEPHGRAALLLIESLMHVLRERSILTLDDVADVLDTAIAVQSDVIDAGTDQNERALIARAFLLDIAASLTRNDINFSPPA